MYADWGRVRAAKDGLTEERRGARVVKYQLQFLNALEQTLHSISIDAPDEQAAIEISCMHCLRANMPVELCDGDKSIFRATPMTARLYLPDDRVPRL